MSLCLHHVEGDASSRYLSVDPILMPCPCNGLRPATRAALFTLFEKFGLGERAMGVLDLIHVFTFTAGYLG